MEARARFLLWREDLLWREHLGQPPGRTRHHQGVLSKNRDLESGFDDK